MVNSGRGAAQAPMSCRACTPEALGGTVPAVFSSCFAGLPPHLGGPVPDGMADARSADLMPRDRPMTEDETKAFIRRYGDLEGQRRTEPGA